jgi:hypothetical protein
MVFALILIWLDRFLIGVHCRLEMHFQVALEGYVAEKKKWPIPAD